MEKTNKNHVFNLSALTASTDESIESYVAQAKTKLVILDPELLSLNLTGVKPAMCSPEAAYRKCKLWVLEQKKRPRVASVFTELVTQNDIQVNLTSMVLPEGKEIVPRGGSLDIEAPKKLTSLAREVANIIVIHSTHKIGSYPEEWITSAKAQKLGLPYFDVLPLRKMLNIQGNDNFITRDAIFAALSGKSPIAFCMLMYCVQTIYSCEKLKEYSVPDPELLKQYIKFKGGLPDLSEIRVPNFTKFRSITCEDPRTAWGISILSNQMLGEYKKRGALSVGYYRFDLPSSEVRLIDEVTDILMICKKYAYTAVRVSELDINLSRILISNGISVYTTKTQNEEPPGETAGVWSAGKRKSFNWGFYSQATPMVKDGEPQIPPVIKFIGKEPSFNYCYLPLKDGEYSFLPSIRACDGLCIVTNTSVGTCKHLNLIRRFVKAQYYRNWFPYLRLTYCNQDSFRKMFKFSWMYPKRVEVKQEDFFANMTVEIRNVQSLEDSSKIYGELDAIPADAEPVDVKLEDFRQFLLFSSVKDIYDHYNLIYGAHFTQVSVAFSRYLAVLNKNVMLAEMLARLKIVDVATYNLLIYATTGEVSVAENDMVLPIAPPIAVPVLDEVDFDFDSINVENVDVIKSSDS